MGTVVEGLEIVVGSCPWIGGIEKWRGDVYCILTGRRRLRGFRRVLNFFHLMKCTAQSFRFQSFSTGDGLDGLSRELTPFLSYELSSCIP